MLVNPERHDFALHWHRDNVRKNAREDEDSECRTELQMAAYPRYVDRCLELTDYVRLVGSRRYVRRAFFELDFLK